MLQPDLSAKEKDSIEQATGADPSAERTTHEPEWSNLAGDDERKVGLEEY